ncbi:LacI family transcriptional regulator [Herbihabitans rhizosphaerae]|uniref:LacI family transcriptional regulator n=1 Tax=Herbihabitans rhizosphaerae TaxID=1872711 RepID=A0A4Q7KQG0_9PSEU|nr:LacI family DNA-binding transcriptional regulator [Herbihabitans rhizosphaerae]RZS39049.1 LacI family transcriptional regulator [Herbihabitans rhizosphaerae]
MARTTRPTLTHVAASAGVSVSTASLAFSGAGPVSERTRQRVLDAAAELGYAGPDPMARSLRQGRTGIIGVVFAERLRHAFRDPVAIALLDGLAEELGPVGPGLLVLTGNDERAGPSTEQLAAAPLDAAVFATCDLEEEPLVEPLRVREIPMVGIEGPRMPGVSLVDIDNIGASREVTEHILSLGHKRIAAVVLPWRPGRQRGFLDRARRDLSGSVVFADRLRGTEEAIGASVHAWEAAASTVEEGRAAGRALLDVDEPPTAIVAHSDLLAAGVIQAAHELGLRVPEDLSVAGFDGIDTPWLDPLTLTTAVQPMVEKGRIAGRMVTDLLAGRTPEDVLLPVHLRVGGTTAPPR